jgi:predicted O-linked N-acetylglucosamine transferase (SPINDLY family)
MTAANTILLLYPTAADEMTGQTLKDAFQKMGITVEELVIEQNYIRVLDAVEKAVIPVVIC